MPMKNVPNTPMIDQITLVLVLHGSSDIKRTSIIENIYMLMKPTHAQPIINEIDPFIVFSTIVFGLDGETLAAIPSVLNILAMNEVNWGMKGENNDFAKSDTKELVKKATTRNRGEKASLRA